MDKLTNKANIDSSKVLICNNAIDWIQRNYKTVLQFAEEQYSDYPEVCDRISPILGAYVKSKFPDSQIMLIFGNYKERYHVWLEVDNRCVDITKFQFLTTDDDFNNRRFNLDFDIVSSNDYNYFSRGKMEVSFDNKNFKDTYGKYVDAVKKSSNLKSYLNYIKYNKLQM